MKRKPTTVAPGGDAEAGIRHKASRDAFERFKKLLCHTMPPPLPY